MRLDLNGLWTFSSDKFNNVEVNVPGTVLSGLLDNKLIPDPFYSKNELIVKEYLKDDYTFKRSFKLLDADLKRVNYLVLDGIDTIADIYINGTLVTSVNDMHIGYKVLLDNKILKLDNEIEIKFESALRYISEYDDNLHFRSLGESMVKSPVIRKANYMFGWDWGPCLPDIGIYRDIYIESTNLGYLSEFRHYEKFNKDLSSVELKIDTKFIKISEGKINIELSFNDNLIDSKEECFKEENSVTFKIKNPNLWNPQGYGEANLYNVKITISKENEFSIYNYRIGLRRIEIDDSIDEYGRRFQVICNNNKVFLKGSDYIPQDNILPRVNKENTLRLLNLAKDFNQNVIRVWGGGYYLDDYFYDLCDELGLLVFQDLMFACALYDMEDLSFKSLIIDETHNVLKRIRHHASIFIICGNNENEVAIASWIRKDFRISKKNFREQYIKTLKPIVKEETDFYYLVSSPTSGDPLFKNPNDMNHLDMHYWDVWHGYKPFEAYKEIYPRLLSEFGCQSFPIYDTVLSYAPEDELDIYSPSMMHHQKNRTCNDKIFGYTESLYKSSKDFKSLVLLSMLAQAEGIKMCVEHLRENRPRCQGVIYWQLNDCWPGQSWSSLDSFYNLKALHYYSKKFYNNYLVSVDESSKGIVVSVSNDELKGRIFDLVYQEISFDGKINKTINTKAVTPAGSVIKALEVNNKKVNYKNTISYVELYLDGNLVSTNFYSKYKPRQIKLSKPEIKIEKVNDNSLCIETNVYAKNVYLEDHDNGLIWSDNYFDILPNKKYIIKANKDIDFSKLEVTSLYEVMQK